MSRNTLSEALVVDGMGFHLGFRFCLSPENGIEAGSPTNAGFFFVGGGGGLRASGPGLNRQA